MSITFPAKEPMNPPEPASRDSFHAVIVELESQAGSADVTGAGTIVEELDELMSRIEDKREKSDCLRVLTDVCRKYVILPESCKISGVELGEERKFGGVADVWMGKHTQGNVCVKVFRQYKDADQEKFKEALYYRAVRWRYLSHLNLLPFLGVSGPEIIPPFGLVTPRMSGNIIEYTKERQDTDRLLLLKEAACGLEYLHSLDIVHGDINPRNILITERGTAQIGDFGIAAVITDPLIAGQDCTMVCRRAIVRYMAPEQLENRVASKESDIHSFAITAYEALVGIEAYPGVTGEGPLAVRIISGVRPFRPQSETAVKWLSDCIWRTLESCWAPEPFARPTIEKVHRAFQGIDAIKDMVPWRKAPPGPSARPDSPRRKPPPVKHKFARFVRTLWYVRGFRRILKSGLKR